MRNDETEPIFPILDRMVIKVLKHLVFNGSQLGIVNIFVVVSDSGVSGVRCGRGVHPWAVLSAMFALQVVCFFAVVVTVSRAPARRRVCVVLTLCGAAVLWAEAWNVATFFFRQGRKRVEIWIVDVVDPRRPGIKRSVPVVQRSEVDVCKKDVIQHIFGTVGAKAGLVVVGQEAMQKVSAVQRDILGQGVPVADFVFDVFECGSFGESFEWCGT